MLPPVVGEVLGAGIELFFRLLVCSVARFTVLLIDILQHLVVISLHLKYHLLVSLFQDVPLIGFLFRHPPFRFVGCVRSIR